MDLSNRFARSILKSTKERWDHSYAIAIGLKDFMDYAVRTVTAKPIEPGRVPYEAIFNKYTSGFSDFRKNTGCYQSYDAKCGDSSRILSIYVSNAGPVGISVTEQPSGKQKHLFDYDSYSTDEAIAKVLFAIQNEDRNYFGPLVQTALERLNDKYEVTPVLRFG